jgi:hypothetical protein
MRSFRFGSAVAWGFVAMGCFALLAAPLRAQDADYERPPIDYLHATADDPVARLQKRLDSGELELRYDGARGYVPAVLEALGIPVSSQVLVFSRTSFQRSRIGPETPRGVYFNDDTYIGFVRGGEVLEVATIDPALGAVFYVLEQDRSTAPRFQRKTHDCLSCHASGRTQDVPGLLVRSVFPDPKGNPLFNAGGFTTDVTSPLQERWGGWYVTGTHGSQTHMGNAVVRDPKYPEQLDQSRSRNVTDLSDRFDTSVYPAPDSDIVALMVLEHQTQMHNAFTWASYEVRRALHYQAGINEAFHEPPDKMLESTNRRIDNAAERVVRHLLFSGEAPLREPIAGTSAFSTEFPNRGRRDPEGRSLRDFDLKTRLFRFPCSYLIESEAFDALPTILKLRIGLRLEFILDGSTGPPRGYEHLSATDRTAIRDLIAFLKPELLPSTSSEGRPPSAWEKKDVP